MDVEHPDITSALLTGYERGKAPPVVTVWQAKGVPSEDVFPYRYDEGEEN